MALMKNSVRDFQIDAKKFIRDIEARPEIWNRTVSSRKKTFERAWLELEKLHKLPVSVLKTKWNSLRDKFRVEYKKRPTDATGKCIDVADFNSRWMHYRDLLFLGQLLPPPKRWSLANSDESENMLGDDVDGDNDSDEIEIDLPTTSDMTVLRLKPIAALQGTGGMLPLPRSIELPAATARLPPHVRTSSSRSAELDEDHHFLMSLQPYLAQLGRLQKLKVRMEIEKLISEEISDERV